MDGYYHLAMGKEKMKIQVQDVQSGQTLYECALEDAEKAYAYAASMEEMGLDVTVIHPSLTATLTNSLGLSEEKKAQYAESMEEEIEGHEGSCCFEDQDQKLH